MDWINYHHLLYFWVTAREGSITRASEKLKLAQPTVSGQIQSLEKSIGERLFLRQGRKLTLTETGRLVFGYADQIFTVGQELVDVVRNRPTQGPSRVKIGVADALPKLVACRVLEAALEDPEPSHLVCREGKPEELLTELATFGVDMVIADAPIPPTVKIKAFNHMLGESPVLIFGRSDLCEKFAPGFPESLDGAPMLLPTENTTVRQHLDGWFDRHEVKPRIVAEFEDSAMLKTFGQRGLGLFPAPEFVESEVCRQYGVQSIGTLDGVREQLYAITIERKIKNDAVLRIIEHARSRLATLRGAASATPA
ncbi:MAG: transcriptional activator NhaR [Planctomycetes bacterium]|nr:transcriptional activator NhaR [Planctomycetota bacterium]